MSTIAEVQAKWAELVKVQYGGDFRWARINEFYWIEDEHGRKVKFKPTPIQRDFYFRMHWRTIAPKARQLRLSTINAIIVLDRALFYPNQTCGIIDKTDEDVKRKLSRIRFAYQHLDDMDDPVTGVIGGMVKQSIALRTDNARELGFANESKIWAGTSMRGGMVNHLWITEFGPIACDFPDKAVEIRSGALNSVHAGNVIIIESTHKGGRYGQFYDMIRLAQSSPSHPNELQWKLLFYGWQDEPSYAMKLAQPMVPTLKQAEYFAELEKAIKRPLTIEQRNWYILKAQEQGDAMLQEFPGTIEEALRANIEGAIYGDKMMVLRAQGRIGSFPVDAMAPIFAFWDIGVSDFTAVWLVQFVGVEIHWINYYTGSGMTPGEHAAAMLRWENYYKKPVKRHFFPHDAARRDTSNLSFKELMEQAGISNISIVHVTPNKWAGINYLRTLLPQSRFHSDCEKEFEKNEMIYPSGVACLEGYRRKIEMIGGQIKEEPVHDSSSHGADAARCLAEAKQRGMIEQFITGTRSQRGAVEAVTGLRRSSWNQRPPVMAIKR